jgi:hypothetical protein
MCSIWVSLSLSLAVIDSSKNQEEAEMALHIFQRKGKKYKRDYRNKDFSSYSEQEIRKMVFEDSNLQGANFEGCKFLGGKNFSGANICGANFEDANLKQANFSNVTTDYPFLRDLLIKAIAFILSILSALVIFYSVDIFQFLISPNDSNIGLETAITRTTEVILLEDGDGACTREIPWTDEACEAANFVAQVSEEAIDKTIIISNEIIKQSGANPTWYSNNREVYTAASQLLRIVFPIPFAVEPTVLFIFILGGAVVTLSLAVNPDLFGLIIVFIALAITLAAPTGPQIAVPIFYALLALLGIVSGLLIRAVSISVCYAAELSKKGTALVSFISWIGSIIAMLCYGLTSEGMTESELGIALTSSIIFLVLGGYIGKKAILGRKRKITLSNGERTSLEFKRHVVLELFTVRLLRMAAPLTNFWAAELDGVNFTRAKLKEYSTSIGGRDYSDETLEAILGQGGDSKKFYEKMSGFSDIWGNSLLYGGLIVNVVKNRMQEVWILGNVDNRDGNIIFGEVFGNVTNTINRLSASTSVEARNTQKELLKVLESLRADDTMLDRNKFKALKSLEKLAESFHSETVVEESPLK